MFCNRIIDFECDDDDGDDKDVDGGGSGGGVVAAMMVMMMTATTTITITRIMTMGLLNTELSLIQIKTILKKSFYKNSIIHKTVFTINFNCH